MWNICTYIFGDVSFALMLDSLLGDGDVGLGVFYVIELEWFVHEVVILL